MKEFRICYTMMDGEVFEVFKKADTYSSIGSFVHSQLEKKSFAISHWPTTFLVSKNVRNVDISEIKK